MNDVTPLERWLPAPGYEGLYDVSDWGRVRSLPHKTTAGMRGGRILRPRPTPTGYLRVHLSRDGVKRDLYIHQLVLLVFVGPCPPGEEARHLDGNPANNRRDNLKWDSHFINMHDQLDHGTARELWTHCSRGHEYTEANTYLVPGTNHRQCRECRDGYEERNAVAGRLCPCGAPMFAKDLCRKHYDQQRWANRGKVS